MISKNLFFKLMREDLKRRMWAGALLSLGFFFFYPVVAAFTAGEIRDYADYAKGLADYENGLTRWLSFNCGMTVFLMMVAALICGLSSFSYLNSKSKVDFYHGIPVRREKLFAINFLDGILLLVIPYGICQVLAVMVGISNGASGSRLWPVALAAFGLHITYFILMYVTVVVAAMMTGHLVIGFLGSMVFAFYIPMAVMLMIAYFSSFFWTYASYLPGLLSENILKNGMRLSPVAEYIYQQMRNGDSYQTPAPMTVPVLIAWGVSLLLAVLACFLYRKRPSEAAGRAMAFPVSRPVIRILLTILSALGLGLFLYTVHSSMGWAVFGIVFGGGICHCVVEIIYHFDFRKLFSHKLQLAGCLVVSMGIMLVFKYDLLGYDRYLPKAGQVREASIRMSGVTNWVSYGQTEKAPDGRYIWKHASDSEYVLQNMKYHDVENLLDIASAGVEQVEENKRRKANGYEGEYYSRQPAEEGFWSRVEICYTLNSGRRVSRIYSISINEKARSAFEKLYVNEEFQRGVFPLLAMTGEQVDTIRFRGKYSRDNENEVCLESMSAEEKAQMLEIYQKEFAAMTVAGMEKEAPVGLIRFSKELDEEAMRWWKQQEVNDPQEYRYSRWRDFVNEDFYPLYPSFTETIQLLQKQGVKVGGYLDDLDVQIIQVRAPLSEEDPYEKKYEINENYYEIEESERIEELRKVLIYDGLCYYDPFFQSENMAVWFLVLGPGMKKNRDYDYEDFENEKWNNSVEVRFPKGEVPEFLWEALR